MKLVELEPRFLKVIDEGKTWRHVETPAEADGLMFLCPVCFVANKGNVGTHAIICWSPHVPLTIDPGPGRWNMVGTSFKDLSLVAGSSSVHLTGPGCGAHFFVRNGEIT